MSAICTARPLVILSVGGTTEGSDAESKDPEDLSRDHAAAGSSPHTLVLVFNFGNRGPRQARFWLAGVEFWHFRRFWQWMRRIRRDFAFPITRRCLRSTAMSPSPATPLPTTLEELVPKRSLRRLHLRSYPGATKLSPLRWATATQRLQAVLGFPPRSRLLLLAAGPPAPLPVGIQLQYRMQRSHCQ